MQQNKFSAEKINIIVKLWSKQINQSWGFRYLHNLHMNREII